VTARLWGLIAALAVLVGAVAGLYAWGRSDGVAAQREACAATVAKKDQALLAASASLSLAATRFREIDAATGAALEEARAALYRAEAAVAEASLARNELAARLAEINAARDTSPCSGEPVGVPLR
jgi:ketopantoate reductase